MQTRWEYWHRKKRNATSEQTDISGVMSHSLLLVNIYQYDLKNECKVKCPFILFYVIKT